MQEVEGQMNLPPLSGQGISGHLFVRVQIQMKHPEGPKSNVWMHDNSTAVNPVLSGYINYAGCTCTTTDHVD